MLLQTSQSECKWTQKHKKTITDLDVDTPFMEFSFTSSFYQIKSLCFIMSKEPINDVLSKKLNPKVKSYHIG